MMSKFTNKWGKPNKPLFFAKPAKSDYWYEEDEDDDYWYIDTTIYGEAHEMQFDCTIKA